MTDTDLERRINFLRLLLIIGLVFLHYGAFPGSDRSPFRGYGDTATPIATFVNSFFLFLFFSAVPVLSAISGYLFFKSMNPTPGFYLKRYRSRVHSVLLPMLSWNAFVVVLFIGIAALWPDSPLQSIITYDVEKLGIGSTLNALVGITRHPVNFQFWFLHDLLLTVLISPLLGLLIRKAPYVGLVGIGAAWLVDYDFVIFFRPDVLFFFYLGGMARLRYWNLDFVSARNGVVLMAIYVVLIGLRTLAPAFIPEDGTLGEFLYGPGTRLLRVLGVAAFWGCAPLLMNTFWGRRVTALGAVAFFLHSIHWPLNQFIKEGLARVIPGNGDAALLLNYFATIAITLAVALLIAKLMTTFTPRLFSHLSGGRSINWSAASEASKRRDAVTPAIGGARTPVAEG
ncbi:acyltransferase family protein [Microvirga pudoricolor]|uniref:acyltransferase family protein n=1 Tax=Microvirga pudoricolor TaxID=2778729 RepID=UPI00194ED666|nr:acyltransferase [Microvirga pudoricolor]MBM6593282.1 acyltransferase [Microvirga pudoricolor]